MTDGARASPAQWRRILIRVWRQLQEGDLPVLAAGVAFYMLLALFPALTALIALYGLFFDAPDIARQLHGLEGLVPSDALTLIDEQLREVDATRSGTLGLGLVGGLLLALWSATKGFRALITALNVAYGDDTHRPNFWQLNARAILFTVGGVAFGAVALALIVALPAAQHLLQPHNEWSGLLSLARWPMLAGAFMLALTLLYRFGPQRMHADTRRITIGSIAATLLWLAGSALFSLYASRAGVYTELYGSLGAIVILMMWVYLSAYIVLLGAKLNREIERAARDGA
jgi:membrane protein